MFVAGLDMLGSPATDSAFGSKGEGRAGVGNGSTWSNLLYTSIISSILFSRRINDLLNSTLKIFFAAAPSYLSNSRFASASLYIRARIRSSVCIFFIY